MSELAKTAPTPAPLTPANDNERQPRPVLAWPTGKRLAAAKRHSDLAMLVEYRRLLDTAYGEAANDNWRNPAPAPGQPDGRALEERIDQREMIMREEDSLPTLDDLHDLSGVPWKGDDGFIANEPARHSLKSVDSAGVRLWQLGALVFIGGAHLFEYTNRKGRTVRPVIDLRRPRRPKKRAAPSIVPSSGTWSLEDQIDARQRVRSLWGNMPASSVRILEFALGSTKAQEIGEAFRKQGKNAERFGVRLVDRAIDHLREAWCP